MSTIWTSQSDYVCDWSMDDECAPCVSKIPDTEAGAALFQRCVNSAAEILYGLSGRQFGLCELVVRPCREECGGGSGRELLGFPWTPRLHEGQWTNVACGKCSTGSCSCSEICEVRLPGPIESITQVLLDGVALDPSEYQVNKRRTLVRLGGECWPTCQEMGLPSTEPGTWEVTYLRGKPVPAGGQAALAELACELCLACLGDKACALPKRVTSISRDGVSFAMLDPMTFINEGLTGLYAVDLWLRSVNPASQPRSGAILSPDMVQSRRTT